MEPDPTLHQLNKEALIERCLHLQKTLTDLETNVSSWIDELTRVSITNQNIKKSLTKGLQLILRASRMDGGYLHILDHKARLLRLRACLGLSKTAEDDLRVIREGEKVPGQVLKKNEALIATSITEVSDLSGSVTQEKRRMLHAGFPLVWDGKVLGTLTVVSKRHKELSEADLAILTALSQFMAAVVQNFTLLDTISLSKKQWEDAIDSVSDLVVICDPDFRIIKTNKTIFERFQLPLEDAIGRECFDLFYNGEPFSVSKEKLEMMLKKGVTYHEEVAPPRWNGIFSIFVSPILTFGTLAGSIHVIKEITHERLLERDREELTRKVSLFATGMMTVDSKGRIQNVDSGASEILGYEKQTPKGKSLSTILPSLEYQRLSENLTKAGGILDVDAIAIGKRGHAIPVSLTFRADRDQEERLGEMTIFIRETGHGAEAKSRHANSTRMTAMRDAVSILNRKVGERLDDMIAQIDRLEDGTSRPHEIKTSLQQVLVHARSIQEVLDRVRHFSEPRTDKKLEPLESSLLIERMVQMIQRKWGDSFRTKGIEFELNPDQRTLPSLRGNTQELLEAFDHLIRNSVEAMPNGGKIILRTRTDRKTVNISLIDDGNGMTSEEVDSAFDPFFTIHPQNLGLGLSIVLNVIHRHYGEVKILSEPDKGTQVSVRLPTIDKQGKKKLPPSPDSPSSVVH